MSDTYYFNRYCQTCKKDVSARLTPSIAYFNDITACCTLEVDAVCPECGFSLFSADTSISFKDFL